MTITSLAPSGTNSPPLKFFVNTADAEPEKPRNVEVRKGGGVFLVDTWTGNEE